MNNKWKYDKKNNEWYMNESEPYAMYIKKEGEKYRLSYGALRFKKLSTAKQVGLLIRLG